MYIIMVEVESQLGFREKTDRERASEAWTSFFEREHSEINSDDLPLIVDSILNLLEMGIEDFDELDRKIIAIYEEFGVETRNKLDCLTQ